MQNSLILSLYKLFNYRLIIVICLIILPLMAINLLNIENNNIDPLILFLGLEICLISGIFLLARAVQNPIIPYIPLQLVYILIFFDKKFEDLIGISPKPYALAFVLGLIITVYYLVKHFKYLWSNFLVFRFLFIFFIFNIPYFLFYHSDFRNSTYVDYSLLTKKETQDLVGAGFQDVGRQFGHDETQFLIYLTGLCPLVSVTISLMVFYGLKTVKAVDERLIKIIKLILAAFSLFFISVIITMALGVTQFFLMDGRLISNLYGGQTATGGFEMFVFLIFFVGLKFYFNEKKSINYRSLINIFLDIFIIIFMGLNIFSLRKTAMLAILAAILVQIIANTVSGLEIDLYSYSKGDRLAKAIVFLLFLFLSFILLFNPDVLVSAYVSLADTIDKLGMRFETIETLQARQTIWHGVFNEWLSNLNIWKILFGYGIDASREAGFFSSISMGEEVSYVHNIYAEMFYDYGLVSFIFFGAIISILVNNVKSIISVNLNTVKILSAISLAIITAFFIYYFAESPLMPQYIILFSLLGLLESAKFAYLKTIDPNKVNL